MASFTPSMRHAGARLHCVRPAAPTPRLFSSSAAARDEALATPPPASTPPAYMQAWGTLDPQMVENKKLERRLLRRDHVQPVGSRRRRAALRRAAIHQAVELPFEQLPYQCFQEARKVLLEDRQDKIRAIEKQQQRIHNLERQDAAVSGGSAAKDTRLRSMRKQLHDLVILADINDPAVKRRFEDGQGTPHGPPPPGPRADHLQAI